MRQSPTSRVAPGAQPSWGSGTAGTPKSRPGMMQSQRTRGEENVGSGAVGGAGSARGQDGDRMSSPRSPAGWPCQASRAAPCPPHPSTVVSPLLPTIVCPRRIALPFGEGHPDPPNFRNAKKDKESS